MQLVCLDLEGVLVPEIWIEFSERSGIAALRRTTRDEPDYDKLMRFRLDLLREHGLRMPDIQRVIADMRPLEGAAVSNFERCGASFRRALGHDPAFALAHYQLAVLLAGGANGSILSPTALATCEVFDAATNTFTAGPALAVARAGAATFRTPQGQLQFFGGAARAYIAEHGIAPSTFARISVKARQHAARNPLAEVGLDAGTAGLQQARASVGLPFGPGFDLKLSASEFSLAGHRPQSGAERSLGNLRLGWQGGADTLVLLASHHEQVEPSAESLWLAVRTERKLGNRSAENDLANQLRRRFPESREARDLRRGNYE